VSEEELEQMRIDSNERLENLEKFKGRIKDILSTIMNQPIEQVDRKLLEEVIEEIEWEVRCLD
jgi:hypothetical protein